MHTSKCLDAQNSKLEKSKVVQECHDWVKTLHNMPASWSNHAKDSSRWESKHPEFVQWWRSSFGNFPSRARRLNMTDCDELEASIDEQCSFDGTQMNEFTKTMKENGGDFTMSFWIKPTGANSMLKNLKGEPIFVPQVLIHG